MCVEYPPADIFIAMPVTAPQASEPAISGAADVGKKDRGGLLRGIAAMPDTGSAGLYISGAALSGFTW